MVVWWTEGSHVIKKCSAEIHLTSNVHKVAFQELLKKQGYLGKTSIRPQ